MSRSWATSPLRRDLPRAQRAQGHRERPEQTGPPRPLRIFGSLVEQGTEAKTRAAVRVRRSRPSGDKHAGGLADSLVRERRRRPVDPVFWLDLFARFNAARVFVLVFEEALDVLLQERRVSL
jgi:hypothetical protein